MVHGRYVGREDRSGGEEAVEKGLDFRVERQWLKLKLYAYIKYE